MNAIQTVGAIHGMVLRRLLAVWLLVALVATVIGYAIEVSTFEEGLVAVATSEIQALSQSTGKNLPPEQKLLAAQTRDFISRHYLWIKVFDGQGQLLREIRNPERQVLIDIFEAKAQPWPQDGKRHVERLTHEEETVIHIVVNLPRQKPDAASAFEGAFILDPLTLRQQRDKLWRMALGIILASLATALALYPVIIALNRNVIRASREILRGNIETAAVLGAAIAKRDSDTGEHNYRVTLYAIALAEAIGLKPAAIRDLILGAFLHDVGKIGIPDAVLLKPGRLDDEEFSAMRQHVGLGLDIVANSHWLRPAREVIGKHHEKFDGSGYPLGLKADDIPLNARIFAIVDVFDALLSQRPYKPPLTLTVALSTLHEGRASHFDPMLLDAFTTIAEATYRKIHDKREEELSQMLAHQLPSYFFLQQ